MLKGIKTQLTLIQKFNSANSFLEHDWSGASNSAPGIVTSLNNDIDGEDGGGGGSVVVMVLVWW